MNEQLAALRDVAGAFERAGIEYRLFGGWAVDFHAGAITRPHDDVDLAIPRADVHRTVELLEAEGWIDLHDANPDQGVALAQNGVRLELTHMWDDLSFMGDDVRELDGTRASVVSLAELVRMKSGGRVDDPDDAAKGEADSAVLRRL